MLRPGARFRALLVLATAFVAPLLAVPLSGYGDPTKWTVKKAERRKFGEAKLLTDQQIADLIACVISLNGAK